MDRIVLTCSKIISEPFPRIKTNLRASSQFRFQEKLMSYIVHNKLDNIRDQLLVTTLKTPRNLESSFITTNTHRA